MSVRRLIFTICCLLLLLAACDAKYPEAPLEHHNEVSIFAENDRSSEVGVQSIIEEKERYTMSVHYPVTGYAFIDEEMQLFTDSLIGNYRELVKNATTDEEERLPYELHLNYEILFRSKELISIQFVERLYVGESNQSEKVYTFNYDIKNNRKLKLEDVLTQGTATTQILYELVLDAYYKENIVVGDPPIEPIDSNFVNFILTDHAMKFWFNPDQLKYKTDAPMSVSLSLKALEQYTALNIKIGPPIIENHNADTPVTLGDDAITYPSTNVRKDKKIALTFESGPHPVYTPIILETLRARDVTASFFYIGKRAKEYPSIVKETASLGHDIGNASYSYPQILKIPENKRSGEIEASQNILEKLTGSPPFLFRAPFGQYDVALIERLRMPIVLWNIDPQDNVYNDPNYITSHVLAYASDGAIVRLRDTQVGTAQAIGAMIDALNEAGYEIVPVSELLNINAHNASNRLRVFTSKN
ncbi:polysaccharide deacetylase family protein [Fusibacter sp. JL298sf-3]